VTAPAHEPGSTVLLRRGADHPDKLAGKLARAVDGRSRHGAGAGLGALLQRDPTTAAKAMFDAKHTTINRSSFKAWLDATAPGGKKTNGAVHGVGESDINKVRTALTALVESSSGGQEEQRPKQHAKSGKKARAAVTPAPQQVVEPIPRPRPEEMVLVYEQEHGQYHFGGNPTDKKTKWSYDVSEARVLMEAELEKHRNRMVQESRLDGREQWYVSGTGPGKLVGHYRHGKGDFREVNVFAMQVTVNLADKTIKYHGYPDEQVLKIGAGKGRNQIT
jgi:hypothetical protein